MANTRLVAILCTLLLLQEFGQATRPGHVCSSDNKELRVNNYEDLDVDDDEENEYDGSADGEDSGENNIAQHYKQSPALHIAGRARFISPKLIFKGFKIFSKITNFVVSFVSLTAAVYRAIEGCCGDLEFPEACTFKEKFEAGKNRVKKDSKTAEELQNKGELDQIWVRSNIEEYERITKRLKAISDKQEMLVKDISPNVKVAMKNASADIKYLMKEEVNKTVNGVKAQSMLNMYNSKVENAINIAFPAIALAFPAGVKIFNYAKERFSPRKLQDLAALDNVDLELPSTSATSKKSNKIAKFYGKFKGKIAAAKQKLMVRYEKAFTVAKRFKAGLELAFGFASAGLQAFYLIKERERCKEMAEQAEAAYKNVTLAEQKIKANLNDIRDHLRIMEEAWNYVRGNMSDQTFLDSLTDVKKLTDDLAKTNTEMTGVSTSIDNFVSNIETSDGYNQTYDLAKDLATNLLKVPFTVSCYSEKMKIIRNVINDCKKGKAKKNRIKGKTFDEIYRDNNRQFENNAYDPSNPANCVDKVGFKYIKKSQIHNAWLKVAANESLNEKCELNRPSLISDVCYECKENMLTAAKIAAKKHGLTKTEAGEIIARCPLTDEEKTRVCWERKTKTNEVIATENDWPLFRVKAVTCPWPLTELQKRRVCLYRHRLNKTDAFIADKLKVDVSQVAAVTCPRPSKDSSKKHMRRG